jgi:hypothetical protein
MARIREQASTAKLMNSSASSSNSPRYRRARSSTIPDTARRGSERSCEATYANCSRSAFERPRRLFRTSSSRRVVESAVSISCRALTSRAIEAAPTVRPSSSRNADTVSSKRIVVPSGSVREISRCDAMRPSAPRSTFTRSAALESSTSSNLRPMA